MTKRGLVLVVGATGSGKSTSLAAMIDHRNRSSAGHIITVEDPVEFVHQSQQSLVTHRDVGIDTHTWHHALKNTLRQAPDVILIGEIRDAETMEHAIAFAETGHLCLGTLHANSANQTIDRIINFFSEERRNQLLMDLSSNLQGHRLAASDPHQRRQGPPGGDGDSASTRRSSPRRFSRASFTRSRPSWASRGNWACAPSTGRLFELYNKGVDFLRRGDPQCRFGQRAALEHQVQRHAGRPRRGLVGLLKAWSRAGARRQAQSAMSSSAAVSSANSGFSEAICRPMKAIFSH